MIRHDLDGNTTRIFLHLAELHEEAARCHMPDAARAAQRDEAARGRASRPVAAPRHPVRALLAWLRIRRPAHA